MVIDRAGNRTVRNLDGSISVVNAKGNRVNKKDSEKFLKKHGFKTKKQDKKLFAKKKSSKITF